MKSLNRVRRRSVILPYTPRLLQNPQQPTLAGPRVSGTGDVNFLFFGFFSFCFSPSRSYSKFNFLCCCRLSTPRELPVHSELQRSQVVPVFRFRLALRRLARITQTAAGHHNRPAELSLPASGNLSPGPSAAVKIFPASKQEDPKGPGVPRGSSH